MSLIIRVPHFTGGSLLFAQYAAEIRFLKVMNKIVLRVPLFTGGSLLLLQYAAVISFLNVIRYPMSATFYWWQFKLAQYAAEISFQKVMNKMSYECRFLLVAVYYSRSVQQKYEQTHCFSYID